MVCESAEVESPNVQFPVVDTQPSFFSVGDITISEDEQYVAFSIDFT